MISMILDLILVIGLASLSVSFLIIFYKALVINKTGQVLLDVNKYHEGWMEAAAFVVFLIVSVYKFIIIYNEI